MQTHTHIYNTCSPSPNINGPPKKEYCDHYHIILNTMARVGRYEHDSLHLNLVNNTNELP